jgi:DNA-binding MarR family transcriptional regulator
MENISLEYTHRPPENLVPYDNLLDEIIRDKNKLLSFFLDKYSLGNGQFQILNIIGWDEGISQEGIASQRNLDKSTIAKSLKKLIENGYIYKVRDENDKRAFCLYCTDKGKEIIPETRNIIKHVDEILTKSSTPEELKVFVKVAKVMSQNIEDFLSKS